MNTVCIPSGHKYVAPTFLRRWLRRRNNVENTMDVIVGSTSCIDVVPTSRTSGKSNYCIRCGEIAAGSCSQEVRCPECRLEDPELTSLTVCG